MRLHDAEIPTHPGPQERKVLTPRQAIIGATALFELNTGEKELVEMAERAELPYGPEHPEATDRLRREWFGFVHAGIIWALMDRTTTEAVAGYIGTTGDLMAKYANYSREESDAFVDDTLTPYVGLFSESQQRQTPHRLLSRVVGENYNDVLSSAQIAFVSGMMAITLCNLLDTLDKYAFAEEEPGNLRRD